MANLSKLLAILFGSITLAMALSRVQYNSWPSTSRDVARGVSLLYQNHVVRGIKMRPTIDMYLDDNLETLVRVS